MKLSIICIAFAVLCVVVNADIYMHNPRGGNNRLNGDGANRDNANRLFDSQNNNKGGYCWGPRMSYYAGSELNLHWTAQHGCGNKNLRCNMVIQYSCSNNYHDGATTATIPYDSENAACFDPEDNPANTDLENPACEANERVVNSEETTSFQGNDGFKEREYENDGSDWDGTIMKYGRHESYIWYKKCDTRTRNKFLFVADQNVGGADSPARRTRQNNNGNRRGLECPEERDYYPYWHPTQWVDIAYLTDDLEDNPGCDWIQSNSQNVKNYGECIDTSNKDASDDFFGEVDWWEAGDSFNPEAYTHNNEESCEAAGFEWVMRGKWDVSAPACRKNRWSRDNHLGNVALSYGAYETNFNWTVPKHKASKGAPLTGDKCVLRIRYNISSTDYDGWNTFAESNGANSPIKNDPYLPFAPLDPTDTAEYAGEQQQGSSAPVNLSLAIATNQFSRTFEDRSHIFRIKQRPGSVSDNAKIHNLNVKGKRGNIVQTYPAVEYDFVPNDIVVEVGDYIHFQWSGCDTNPGGNDGEGRAQTDRSNIVFMRGNGAGNNHFGDWDESQSFFGSKEKRYMFAHLNQGMAGENEWGGPMSHGPCASYDELTNGGQNNADQQREDNCMKLNAATQYFDGGLTEVKDRHAGNTYHYMSSRNNNFTNRSQKGSIRVSSGPVLEPWVMAIVGVVAAGAIALLVIPMGVFGPWIVTSVIAGSATKVGVV